MATMKELLSLMIERINGKPGNWEELTGKPFGLTMGWEILVEQPDIIGSGYSQEPYSAFVALTDVTLEQGKIYKVAINGDEWEVKAFVLPEDTNVYLGDASDRLEEMPFHIYSTEDKTICIIWQITPEEYEMGAPMANIAISKGYEAVDTLGYEFMPLDYPAVLKEYVEILPKAVIRFEETGLNGSVYSNSTIINEGLLSEDKAYRITFNGEKYICQSQVWRGSAFLGNMEILTGTDGNDLPFAILGNMLNWKVELGEEVNLQIEEINNIIRPIDKKFIPDGVGGGVRSVNNTMPDENGNVEISLPEVKWDDVQDKPFGVKTATEWVEISNIPSIAGTGPINTCYFRGIGSVFNVTEEGKSYKVIINDTEFEAVSYKGTVPYAGDALIIGSNVKNMNEIVDGAEVPFSIYTRLSGNNPTTAVWHKDFDNYISLKIYEEQEVEATQPLDYKFMPEGYPKVEVQLVEILPEKNIIVGDYGFAQINAEFELIQNNEYKVIYDDVEYNLIAKVNSEQHILLGGDVTDANDFDYTDCPFVIMENSGNWTLFTETYNVNHIFTIYEEVEIVKPIDPKFLPENMATKEYVDNAIDALGTVGGMEAISWNELADKPFDIQEGVSITQLQMGMSARAFDGVFYMPVTTYAAIEENQTYVFYFNGVNYFITFQQGYSSYLESEALIAGSMNEILANSEFPFQIVKYEGSNSCTILWPESLGRELLMVMYKDESVQKLDARLMPEGTLTSSEWFVPVFADQEIEFTPTGGYFMATLPALPSNWDIKAGSASVVRFNGSWSTSAAWQSSIMDAVCIGNGSLIGDNAHTSQAKFVVIINKDGTMLMVSGTEGTALVGIQAEVWMYNTIDEKFLPGNLARKSDIEAALGSGGATSWNDLTDKPFYEETKIVEIIPQQTVQGGEEVRVETSAIFTEGVSYTVIYDGVEYHCVAYLSDGYGYVGNGELWGRTGGNGEPFIICDGNPVGIMVELDGEHTISVKGPQVVVTPIEHKYMPEDYPKKTSTVLYELPLTTIDVTNIEDGASLGNHDVFFYGDSNYKYKIVFDNVTYNCVPKIIGENLALGNASLKDSSKNDTYEPFLICRDNWGDITVYTKEVGVHSISFTLTVLDIEPIPNYYIKREVIYFMGDAIYDGKDGRMLCAEEVYDLIYNGNNVIISLGSGQCATPLFARCGYNDKELTLGYIDPSSTDYTIKTFKLKK